MKYKVVIEETISQEFEIEAENPSYARVKAVEGYKNGNIILDNGEVHTALIGVEKDGEIIDWDRI